FKDSIALFGYCQYVCVEIAIVIATGHEPMGSSLQIDAGLMVVEMLRCRHIDHRLMVYADCVASAVGDYSDRAAAESVEVTERNLQGSDVLIGPARYKDEAVRHERR